MDFETTDLLVMYHSIRNIYMVSHECKLMGKNTP